MSINNKNRKKMKLQNVYFRASQVGRLMVGCKPKTAEARLTELQHKDYLALLDKEELTPAQSKKLDALEAKIYKPNTLSDTAKAYCYEVFLEDRYLFREDISNKYIRKGILSEPDSLLLLSRELGDVPLFKNHKKLVNEDVWLAGTFDAATEDTVYDVKSSWSPYTFIKATLEPLYEWQLRAYMFLTGLKKAELAYCLVDMPPEVFADLERQAMWQAGEIDNTTEKAMIITAQLTQNYLYSDNNSYTQTQDSSEGYKGAPRVKRYQINRDAALEAMLIEQLALAKEFTESLTLNYKPDGLN